MELIGNGDIAELHKFLFRLPAGIFAIIKSKSDRESWIVEFNFIYATERRANGVLSAVGGKTKESENVGVYTPIILE